jgi:hypothetical protein
MRRSTEKLGLGALAAAILSCPSRAEETMNFAEWSFAQGHISGGYWALEKVVDCLNGLGGPSGTSIKVYARADVIGCSKKVEAWLDEASKNSRLTAECMDGTVTRAKGRHVCSANGGVKTWMK